MLCKKDATVPAKTKMVVYSSAGILSENNFSDLPALAILCFSGEENNIDKKTFMKKTYKRQCEKLQSATETS
ncbi:MAG: hypothetical protein L6V90_02370 [Treponema succinifaciens]|nr:MAG: hypothetical protein L6V90_02370 [Treponema succinifaciens]